MKGILTFFRVLQPVVTSKTAPNRQGKAFTERLVCMRDFKHEQPRKATQKLIGRVTYRHHTGSGLVILGGRIPDFFHGDRLVFFIIVVTGVITKAKKFV